MMTKEEFYKEIGTLALMDGATGSNLRLAGMPKDYSTELWILENPEILQNLQQQYVQAGAKILYAPTLQAQPIALDKYGRGQDTEKINAELIALTRAVAPGCLVAGDITTLAAFCDSHDPRNFDLLVKNYRRQIHGLIDGGADILGAETLLYPQEAEAILTAAELEGAGAAMYTFTMQSDGRLFSGMEAGPVLKELERSGAAAVGFNCVAADEMTAGLVARLRRYVSVPLVCKPNAGMPVIGMDGIAHYDMNEQDFARIVKDCVDMGAALVGGCCGTTPGYIAQLKKML